MSRSGDGYELRLEGRVAGATVLTQASSGDLDGAGVAPVRFTDQRRRRGIQAANFQRGAGKLTYSGPAAEFALPGGVQDRLSWMVQLAAIVEAEVPLREPGARVVMPVTGANGDLSVWVFACQGADPLVLDGVKTQSLAFVREPRGPYDTRIQVWLDPARGYLPVRITQKSGPSDEGVELRLESPDREN